MFKDREEAGLLLARKIKKVLKEKNMVVIALTRGGVVVGKVISKILNLTFDILVVKKIGAPLNPELAIGAVGPKDSVYWNNSLCKELGVTSKEKVELKNRKEKERKEQEEALRGGKKPITFERKTVILVDDGIATGATVLAANKYLKKEGSNKVVLAVPVVSADTLRDIKNYFDMVIALKSKRDFMAVGEFYEYFPQVTNEEVIEILRN